MSFGPRGARSGEEELGAGEGVGGVREAPGVRDDEF